MSETFPITPEDKLSPDGSKERIDDVAKAQLEAKSMKPYEDESAAIRYVTENAMKREGHRPSNGRIDYGDFEQELLHGESSESPSSLTEDRMSALENLNQDERKRGGMLPVEAAIERIEHNNKTADDTAGIVGETYDKLENTKR